MRDSAQQMLLSAALRRMENRLMKLEGSVELVLNKLEELIARPSVTLMVADDSGSETTQVAEEPSNAEEDLAEYRMLGEQGN